MILDVSNTTGGAAVLEVYRGTNTVAFHVLGTGSQPVAFENGDQVRVAVGAYPTPGYYSDYVALTNGFSHLQVLRTTDPSAAVACQLVTGRSDLVDAGMKASMAAKAGQGALWMLLGVALWASWQRTRR